MDQSLLNELQKAKKEIDELRRALAVVTNEFAVVLSEKRKAEQEDYSTKPCENHFHIHVTSNQSSERIAENVMKRLEKQKKCLTRLVTSY